MAITARVGELPKRTAPKPSGTMGKVKEFVSSVLNAPGSEFGPSPLAMPGMVLQKAGVPLIRRLISKQIPRVPSKVPGVMKPAERVAGEIGFPSKFSRHTPIVKKNLANIAKTQTGKPTKIIGFRAETVGGPVPGRGIFFGSTPEQARAFKVPHRQEPRGFFSSPAKRFEVLEFKNPVVFQAKLGKIGEKGVSRLTTQHQAMVEVLSNPKKFKLSATTRSVGKKILKGGIRPKGIRGEEMFTRIDKWMARAAKEAGYDGIIYKGLPQHGGQIVDLGGTVTKTAAKRAR